MQKALDEVNAIYRERESTIESLHAALQREIPLLVQELHLTTSQAAAVEAYIEDRVTLFRFLRKHKFSLPHTLSIVLDTVKWRIQEDVENVSLSHLRTTFFSRPFCFFRGYDKIGRPVMIIQLSEFPQPSADDVDMVHFLRPFVIFLMETVRRYTLDITRRRIEERIEPPVIADILVLVDFRNAKPLPRDPNLIQAFIELARRFPLSAGTVCLLNFGWIYQGMWQMVKLLLTEEAKNRISFPKNKELHAILDDTEAIAAFDSKMPVSWNLETDDTVFSRYDTLRVTNTVLPSPPSSPTHFASRRNSTSSTTSTIYYDTETTLPFSARSRRGSVFSSDSVYATPNISPSSSQQDLANLAGIYSSSSSSKGLQSTLRALGEKLLAPSDQTMSSLTQSEKSRSEDTPESQLPHQRRRRQDIMAGLVPGILIRAQAFVKMLLLRGLQKYKGAIFWIVAYIFLRQSIQRLLQMLLTLVGRLLMDYPASSTTGTGSAGAACVRILLGLTTGHVGQWSL